jgi:hypothetical protein
MKNGKTVRKKKRMSRGIVSSEGTAQNENRRRET